MTHTRARRVAAALAVTLLGVGAMPACTTEVPTVPDVPEASTTLSTTPGLPTPTPTAEAATPNDPADPDTWVITDTGIGPIGVNDDYRDALEAVRGTTVGPVPECDGVAYGIADDNSYDILVIRDRFVGSDDIVEVTVTWNGDTMGVGPRTEEDLGLGTPKEQVLATYDDAIESPSVITERSFVSVVDAQSASKLVFTYRKGYDGAVSVSVITGQEPSYEPCA